MTADLPTYLDFNATTPTDEAVIDAMLPWFSATFGNASSTHAHGQIAAAAVQESRHAVAESLGVPANGIVFTSGATEANNLAIRGVPGTVVAPATEHKAVLDTARAGHHVIVPVDERGRLDLDALERAAQDAALISVMVANNETGVVHDLEAVVEVGRRVGCLVHTDATQAYGKLATDFGALGVDLVSVSAHKVYGPKGVGALYVRRGVQLESVMTGGGHERGFRSGTSNVPAIVGFGVAARRMRPEETAQRSRGLMDRLLEGLVHAEPFTVLSDHAIGLPNTLNVRFHGADAEAVIANAPEICISTGSACTAAVPEPSHVLIAMGLTAEQAFESLRISVGEPTTPGSAVIWVTSSPSSAPPARSEIRRRHRMHCGARRCCGARAARGRSLTDMPIPTTSPVPRGSKAWSDSPRLHSTSMIAIATAAAGTAPMHGSRHRDPCNGSPRSFRCGFRRDRRGSEDS